MHNVGRQIRSQTIKGLQIQKLERNEGPEILSITLEKGTVFPEHTSPKDAFLIVLQGAVEFLIDGKSYTLNKFEDMAFPKEVAHRVHALEDSRFLIIR